MIITFGTAPYFKYKSDRRDFIDGSVYWCVCKGERENTSQVRLDKKENRDFNFLKKK